MEKRKEGLAPFSSDECGNSGEDSDEDVITDYLGSGAASECSRATSIVNGDLAPSCYAIRDESSSGVGGVGGGGGGVAHTHAASAAMAQPHHQHSPQHHHPPNPVPIISVTPHTAGIAKHYPVLEEPLRQLHKIHDTIYQMRDSALAANRAQQGGEHLARFSTSCPSLCPLISVEGVLQTGSATGHGHQHHEQDGSDPDLLTNCSTNSSPTHFPGPQGIDRRRSWTNLEDSRQHRRGSSDHNLLQAHQNIRQRSISLSSLDSDMDLELDGKARETNNKPRSSVSQSSTHSLNEADFVQNEFKKVVVKRGVQRLGENVSLMPGVTGSRLPLQKSVSTPSIVIPPGQTHLTETGARVPPSLSASRHERHEKGSGSETETDDLHIPHGHEFHEDLMREGTPNTQASLDELLTESAYDDRHSEKTKRKRGSLFSRKKKDKSGKKPAQAHQWTAINVSSQGNNSCDFCMKPFSNKPALHCETCGGIIHQSCKDHYQPECNKSKAPSKSSFKSLSSVSISSSSSIVKRGSTASLPLPTSIGSGSQTINEERDGDGSSHRDVSSGMEDFDFDDTHQFSLEEFDALEHPELGLGREEPDSWSASIGRKSSLQRGSTDERKEVKRQEHIYEFILTEKHHCLVLLAMQRIFVVGLKRHLSSSDLDRMFPKLQELIDIHFGFLAKLRQRQSENSVVPTIADLLIDQFSGDNAERMKLAYGEFCSRHRDAVDVYKQHLQQEDQRFAKFVRACQNNPLLKKKGIHECITFVTQRLTKYPLLIEPLIKTGVGTEETESLRKALSLIKEILNKVDACVAEKERTDRKLDIYHKIDAKSYAMYRGNKFKKSDILASNRNLKFEGTAHLMQGSNRQKAVPVVVVCLTDVLFFLTGEQKYVFFPENKGGIVSLQKLLVREKAGTESRGLYLISSNPSEPEMFELKIKDPRDKRIWIESIRAAVEECPLDFENDSSTFMENNMFNEIRDSRSLSLPKLSSDDKHRLAKENRLQSILDELRKKDEEQASLFEQKMELHMRLHHAINFPTSNEDDLDKLDKEFKDIPNYLRLIRGEGISSTQIWQEALEAVQEAMRLASSLSCGVGGGTLSRSLSSAGERHSDAYVPPSLAVPRRAETFAGFDHNKERYPWRDSVALNNTAPPTSRVDEAGALEPAEHKEEDELDAYRDQREIAVRLSHYVHTLLCIISNQMTTNENLQAQLALYKESSMSKAKPNPNRQLEELRNLQDQLSREKAEFRQASQLERAQLEEDKAKLNKQRAQMVAEQRDVEIQREQLYRKLEALTRQGVSLTGGAPVPVVPIGTSSTSLSETSSRKKSQNDEKKPIPQHLFSATNQHKVQQMPVKQQLPLKLASGSNSNSRSGSMTSNNSPDRHSRTGSSPAIVGSSSTLSSPELGSGPQHSNGSSALSHFSMSNRSLRYTRIPEPYPRKHQQPSAQQAQPQQAQQQQQPKAQQPLEEEVLFL